jgi:hypothetical protein
MAPSQKPQQRPEVHTENSQAELLRGQRGNLANKSAWTTVEDP